MAFVDDDEVEEVARVLTEVRLATALAHEGLENREEDAAVHRDGLLLRDRRRIDPHERVLREGRERIECLIGEHVAVCQEQDPRAAASVTVEVPTGVEELPRELERDVGFARSGGEREQDPLVSVGNRFEDLVDGDLLVVPRRVRAALGLGSDIGEPVAPLIALGERHVPQFLRGRVRRNVLLVTGRHVDRVDLTAVRRVGEADVELGCVLLRLADTLGVREVEPFGLDHRELLAAVLEHVVGDVRLGPLA